MYDIVIIGAGPAGLTASIYARRAGKSVLLVEKENFGGQITQSPKVENYPAFCEISGTELADKMLDQATNLGADVELDEVVGIEKAPNGYTVKGARANYDCKSVIISTGSKHRSLGLENEQELVGNGISYCAVCDGAFYAGQTVAVIGGGNSALQDAVLLSERCKKVIIVQNLSFLTGEELLQNKLKAKDNVEIIVDNVANRLIGTDVLTALEIKNTQTNELTTLTVDGVFVAIGQKPENEPFKSNVDVNDYGYIVSSETCLTKDNGIFVAGDCRTKCVRQITTATADGATAALAACRYIDSL